MLEDVKEKPNRNGSILIYGYLAGPASALQAKGRRCAFRTRKVNIMFGAPYLLFGRLSAFFQQSDRLVVLCFHDLSNLTY